MAAISSSEVHTPSASPAKKAAPRAVVSLTAARTTGTPSRSAWKLQQQVHDRRPAVHPQLGQRRADSGGHGVDHVPGLVGHGLHHCPGQLGPAHASGEPDERAPGVGVPPGAAEAGEGRDQVGAAGVGDRCGQRTDLGRVGDEPEPVAQPLDGRAR